MIHRPGADSDAPSAVRASRIALLGLLESEGATPAFWRLFFRSLDELGPGDLQAVLRAAGPLPQALAAAGASATERVARVARPEPQAGVSWSAWMLHALD